MVLTPSQAQRLAEASVIWVATVRPNMVPHLVPLWAVYASDRLYLVTSARSVKARNLAANPNVAVSLEDGIRPLVVEGTAVRLAETPPEVIQAYKAKYDWDLREAGPYDAVIEITPRRVLLG